MAENDDTPPEGRAPLSGQQEDVVLALVQKMSRIDHRIDRVLDEIRDINLELREVRGAMRMYEDLIAKSARLLETHVLQCGVVHEVMTRQR